MINDALEIITPPDDLDLLDELKSNLRIYSGDAEDAECTRYINTAYKMFEYISCNTLLPTEYRQHFSTWNTYGNQLSRGKIISVDAVKYYDTNDSLTTCTTFNISTNPNGYRADIVSNRGVVYFPNGYMPSVSIYRRHPFYVEYTAGSYASQSYIPDDILTAILLLAGHYYEYRESHTTDALEELPMGFTSIAKKYSLGLGEW